MKYSNGQVAAHRACGIVTMGALCVVSYLAGQIRTTNQLKPIIFEAELQGMTEGQADAEFNMCLLHPDVCSNQQLRYIKKLDGTVRYHHRWVQPTPPLPHRDHVERASMTADNGS